MNKITKKSFYSFLALYLVSSFLFLSLAAYWFYNSQVAMEKNANFYKMNHTADLVSAKVIEAHMHHTKFKLDKFRREAVALFDANKHLLYGRVVQDVDFSKDFYMKDGIFTLVTQRTAGHLHVKYIVIQSDECVKNIQVIKNKIAYAVIITAFLIIIIAVFLSYIFLKPLKDKMQEIEDFVKDTTHELNTPITAIMMSASRLKAKKDYDEKTIKNISISTKQLYDIYASLSFLSFDNSSEEAVELMFDEIVKEDIAYFSELLEKKKIQLQTQLAPCPVKIAPTKAKMLINNLLGNAIKYSNPNTNIKITTTKNSLIIQDEGIGIKKDKLNKIFKRFVRANSYAGGFGVGLNIVEGIVNEYGFHIDIKSKENIGTMITIIFA
ncbi:sensor histidine kinase [Sulfurimonas autotrophica]|uniref:histidine kinase n=1 Tax=Sulfurimonas autotrophica (strain ATCC BAA-671 / DSM 16294 / JCM 11897 / OK10) TaxID=563040 RepID=E0URW2_SULAO|nr:HAMP domain-containing sensor histidine kinase [Sulfurimonas autotrophica]ADN10126.1 integral membrane sensor signal transduction histidine kinase [Sulfurimonas autotrophica DSM 16294]